MTLCIVENPPCCRSCTGFIVLSLWESVLGTLFDLFTFLTRIKLAYCVVLFLVVATILLSIFVVRVPLGGPRPGVSPTASSLLPPGAKLPSEVICTSRVHRSSWEPRPDNATANHQVPTTQQIAGMEPWGPSIGFDPKADTLRKQITGDFTGTTDEIFQWVACKWGISADIVRAEAIVESHWHQNQVGDWTTDSSSGLCPPGTWNGEGCYQSYGILQIKYVYNKSAWPMSRYDTAFNAEYMYGVIRTCYEGWTTYLYDRTPTVGYPRYHAGDLWGCIGRWYSGGWYDQDALQYIASVKAQLASKEWLELGF